MNPPVTEYMITDDLVDSSGMIIDESDKILTYDQVKLQSMVISTSDVIYKSLGMRPVVMVNPFFHWLRKEKAKIGLSIWLEFDFNAARWEWLLLRFDDNGFIPIYQYDFDGLGREADKEIILYEIYVIEQAIRWCEAVNADKKVVAFGSQLSLNRYRNVILTAFAQRAKELE
ncbi:MAG: hypothetical protein LBP59_10770 [Planctomycetaceae bacterium]|jgi:hypothetical protein|nr:hypothetical protein [Planctomycetaceae bacterium]